MFGAEVEAHIVELARAGEPDENIASDEQNGAEGSIGAGITAASVRTFDGL
jgi:hypothetical protein